MISRRLCLIVATGVFAAGLAFPAPVSVAPAALENPQQPQMAASADGTIHLVFGTKLHVPHTGPGRKPPTDGAIYHTATRDGKTFSPPVKIADLAKVALGMRRGPRIVAAGKSLIVTAQTHEDANVHAWLSSDNGQTWKEQARLNGISGSAGEGLHALAANSNGLIAAAWIDHRSGGAEVWSRVSQDGGDTWEPERLVYRSPDGSICQCCAASVAVGRDGRIAVMWRNALGGSRDLYSSVSEDRGRSFAAAVKLGTGTWTLNACPMDGGGIAWNPHGQLEAVWRRELTVYLSDERSPETQIATQSTQPLIAWTGQGRVLMWESDGALVLQLPSRQPERFAASARFASLLPLADGRLAFAWESSAGTAPEILFQVITLE